MSRYDELYMLAKEIETNLHRVQATVAGFAAARVVMPIPGGCGTVTVTGTGQLVSVDLERGPVSRVTGAALARGVEQAIRRAEEEARITRERRLADARRDVSL